MCFEKAANAQTNDILWCCGKYIHLRCLNDVRRLVRDECPHCRTASPSLRSEPTPLPNFLRGSDDTAVNKLIETGCHVIYITLPDESLNHLLFLNDDDARAPPPLRTSVSFENSLRVPWEVISAAPLAVELPPEDPWGGARRVWIGGEAEMPVVAIWENQHREILSQVTFLGTSPGYFSIQGYKKI